MSDLGLTRSNADAVLKEFYLPGIRSILNNEIFLLTQMETNTEDVEGRHAVLSIHTGRNEGVGARAELGTLPAAGRQGYAEQRVPLKYNYGRIQISGPVMRSMGSDRGSFTRAVQSETSGVVRDLRNDVNRQLYGDGSGAIAAVSGANSTVTIPLTGVGRHVMRQLRVGMKVDIGTKASPTAKASGIHIVAVDRANETIELESAPGSATASTDFVFRHGSGGINTAQKEMTGLDAQVASSGALWNIDPANVPDWAAHEATSAGAVSEDMFIDAAQEVNLNSGEQLDLWITTSEIHRGVANLMTSLKRFPSTTELRGGYTALDISDISQGNQGSNTVGLFYEKDMTEEGAAYGLTTRRWAWYKSSDWEFMQEDGAILSRVANTDAYEATLFLYSEIATDGRNAHAKISGITVS